MGRLVRCCILCASLLPCAVPHPPPGLLPWGQCGDAWGWAFPLNPCKAAEGLPAPLPHLDHGVDGEGQESLSLVEDGEDRERHKCFLSVHGVLLGHQRVDSKQNQRDLGGGHRGSDSELGT